MPKCPNLTSKIQRKINFVRSQIEDFKKLNTIIYYFLSRFFIERHFQLLNYINQNYPLFSSVFTFFQLHVDTVSCLEHNSLDTNNLINLKK